jgi:hypothetical protein
MKCPGNGNLLVFYLGISRATMGVCFYFEPCHDPGNFSLLSEDHTDDDLARAT